MQVHSNHVSFNNFPNSLAYLSSFDAAFNNSAFDGIWDATQWGVGGSATNTSGRDYVAYLWTSVPGYSAFGSYEGNNAVDGPFIYTGFRPALVIIKRIPSNGSWLMFDSTRNPHNPSQHALASDLANNEFTPSGNNYPDILSNGFKVSTAVNVGNEINGNGAYAYAAFAENPFQSPVTAR